VFYRKGLYYASFDDSQFNFELHDTHRVQVVAVVVPLKLNYALCLLKDTYRPLRRPLPSLENRFREAVGHCSEVLNLFKEKQEGLADKDKAKALYRRGLARMGSGDLDRAKEDLTEALKLESGNKDIRTSFGKLKERRAEEHARTKDVWAGKLAAGLPRGDDDESDEELPAVAESAPGDAKGSVPAEQEAGSDASEARDGETDAKLTGPDTKLTPEQRAIKAKAEIKQYLDDLQAKEDRVKGMGWRAWFRSLVWGT